MATQITRIAIAYQPALGAPPVFRVDYARDGALCLLDVVAHDAIEARQIASARLGIPFSLPH